MSNPREGGWWCPWCRQNRKATSNNCCGCGAHWRDCVQTTRKSPRRRRRNHQNQQNQEQEWNYTGQWNQNQTTPWAGSGRNPSPRRGPAQRPRAATKSPARQAFVDKKGNKQTQNVPPPEPEWKPDAHHIDETPPAAASSSTAEAQLRDLVAALKKSENALDGEVQNALSKVTVVTPEQATKLLQSATARHANARDALRKAKRARQNLHKNWRKFLADAVTRWQQHSENFSKEDTKLETAIAEANAVFQSARTHLEETKDALIEFDSATGEIQEVSDDENMPDAVPTLSNDIKEVVSNLTRLRDQHDEIAEQSALKKARKEDDGPAEDGTPLPKALQPFGSGGK
eukprot:s1636_g3.t1